MTTSTETKAFPCRYCGRNTRAADAATPPWRSGSEWVVNCKNCAGWAMCTAGHEWDPAEFGQPVPKTCPQHGLAW